MIKNILIAMDSFKGALSSKEAGEAVQRGIKNELNVCSHVISVADGGEGSLDAIYNMCGGKYHTLMCEDAFHQSKKCEYLIIEKENKKIAYIESAKVIGLHDIKPNAETVKKTSSYGLGMLISKIIDGGVQELVVFLGGTITTDGGLGILQAFDIDLYDIDNNEIGKDENPLFKLDSINLKKLEILRNKFCDISITIAADVSNIYHGDNGAAHIFAAQKGATQSQIKILDNRLKHFNSIIDFVDLQKIPRSGAAGGIGGALCILGGHPLSGFDLMNKVLELEKYVKKANLIITGEGSIDMQSEQGKLPYKMASLAKKHNIPIVALCGKKEDDIPFLEDMFNGVFAIQNGPVNMQNALNNTAKNLESISKNLIKIVQI